MTTEPGQRMHAVLTYIARHPGCSKAEAGRGGGASYDSVQRVIRRGYAREARAHPAGNYELHLTDAGQQLIDAAQPVTSTPHAADSGVARRRGTPASPRKPVRRHRGDGLQPRAGPRDTGR